MLFDVYGTNAPFQWLGWVLVFVGLILANEFARRSKVGGLIMFGALPMGVNLLRKRIVRMGQVYVLVYLKKA